MVLRVLQIKHRRLVRSDRASPPAYQQLLAQRAHLYSQLQELQSQMPAKATLKASKMCSPHALTYSLLAEYCSLYLVSITAVIG